MYQTGFRIIVILYFSTGLWGCKNADHGNELMDGSVGGSYYYVRNQTDLNLLVQFPLPVYDRSIDSIILLDSTIHISPLTTAKILEDMGNFGFNPTPAHTFKEIKFYTVTDQQKELVLNIKPVNNSRWNANILYRDEYGYGLTEYQFVVKKEDLQ